MPSPVGSMMRSSLGIFSSSNTRATMALSASMMSDCASTLRFFV